MHDLTLILCSDMHTWILICMLSHTQTHTFRWIYFLFFLCLVCMLWRLIFDMCATNKIWIFWWCSTFLWTMWVEFCRFIYTFDHKHSMASIFLHYGALKTQFTFFYFISNHKCAVKRKSDKKAISNAHLFT